MEISCPSAELLWLNHLLFTYKVAGFDKKSCLIILKFLRICMNISLCIMIQIMALFQTLYEGYIKLPGNFLINISLLLISVQNLAIKLQYIRFSFILTFQHVR